jgi:hypothetical protein
MARCQPTSKRPELAATEEALMVIRSLVALLAVVLLAFGTGVAHAVTLRTPFVDPGADQEIRIYVTNLGTKPIEDLTVTLTNTFGQVVPPDADLCEENGPPSPLASCLVIYGDGASGFATVTGKGKLRATINVLIGVSGSLVAVVPATK